jgi:Putative prokaryotic signal transducing protein
VKRVFRHDSVTEVGLLRGLLEHAGITCITKNEALAGALGEIPFLECQPELWVVDDADRARAEAIIAAHYERSPAHADWTCRRCGEKNEGQFSACWRCGTADRED